MAKCRISQRIKRLAHICNHYNKIKHRQRFNVVFAPIENYKSSNPKRCFTYIIIILNREKYVKRL